MHSSAEEVREKESLGEEELFKNFTGKGLAETFGRPPQTPECV